MSPEYTYPLIRSSLTNGKLMSALCAVLLLYHLPRFLAEPSRLALTLLIIAFALTIDAVAHFMIYKRPVCSVSSAVTALIVSTLAPGAPLWALVAAVAFALILGKAVWGGFGKNPLNPAMLGVVLLGLMAPSGLAFISAGHFSLLLPALALSLLFIPSRPYACIGMLSGTQLALLMQGQALAHNPIFATTLFFSCLVITDPVTMTAKPVPSLVLGLLAGFIPGITGQSLFALAMSILLCNALSYGSDRLLPGTVEKSKKVFRGRMKIPFSKEDTPFIDLTGLPEHIPAAPQLSNEEMISPIERHGVFGYGGAAFPAARKRRAVITSDAPEKHFIVNACECDPGLLHDKWLLTHRADDLKKGIALIMRLIPFASVTVAAKAFYGVSFDEPIQSFKAGNFYPAGAEALLIEAVRHQRPDADNKPSEAGILVFNLQTVIAIYEAVIFDRPAEARYLTLVDLDARTGAVARVRLGSDVFETAEAAFKKKSTVYVGGGVMNAHQAQDGDAIDSRVNCLAVGRVSAFREALCSGCSRCSAYCPVSLSVREIASLVDAGKTEKAQRLKPEMCLRCSLCSAVCPAGRDQAARVRKAISARQANAARS
jgi:Na+-translocating ferredoxin:NAD+ oxidoreductase RnfD subunit/ferredoxin